MASTKKATIPTPKSRAPSRPRKVKKHPGQTTHRSKKTRVKKAPARPAARKQPVKRPAPKKQPKASKPLPKTRRPAPAVKKSPSKKKPPAPAKKRKAKARARQVGLVLGGLVRVPRKDVVSVLRKLDEAHVLIGSLKDALATLRAQRAEERATKARERAAGKGKGKKQESAQVRELRTALAAQQEQLAAQQRQLSVEITRALKAEEDLNRYRLTDALLKAEPVEILRNIQEYEDLLRQDSSDTGRTILMQFLASRAEATAEKLEKSVDEVLYDIAKAQGFKAQEVFTAWHSPSLSYAA